MSNDHRKSLILTFRRAIGLAALILLIAHLFLCLLVVVSQKQGFARTTPGKAYNRYVLLGPFFSGNRITHALHLHVRSYSNGSWTNYKDVTGKYFKGYLRQPWNTQHLVYRDYTRELASMFANRIKNNSSQAFDQSSAFKKLSKFIAREFIAVEPQDSIQLVYIMRSSEYASRQIKPDTLFNIKYAVIGR